jgi:hypothetical protein
MELIFFGCCSPGDQKIPTAMTIIITARWKQDDDDNNSKEFDGGYVDD